MYWIYKLFIIMILFILITLSIFQFVSINSYLDTIMNDINVILKSRLRNNYVQRIITNMLNLYNNKNGIS